MRIILAAILGSLAVSAAPDFSKRQTCQALYAQCGGIGWTGSTCCVSGSSCSVLNSYFFQCVPGTTSLAVSVSTVSTKSTTSTTSTIKTTTMTLKTTTSTTKAITTQSSPTTVVSSSKTTTPATVSSTTTTSSASTSTPSPLTCSAYYGNCVPNDSLPTSTTSILVPTMPACPNCLYVGRVDTRNPAFPQFAWSGSGVIATVSGSTIAVSLVSLNSPVYFVPVIDGVAQARILSPVGKAEVILATGLASGNHRVELYRDNEASETL
ncbi:hypothetical protein HK096_007393, partial [Nowakowskiella sp. JEL0078]